MNLRTERYLNAIIQTAFILIVNTFGIWFTYLVIKLLFKDLLPELEWPGITTFVTNGSFLIITFSILTTVLVTTTKDLRLNSYNGLAMVLLIITALVYIRCIGLNGKTNEFITSLLPFPFSILLLFFSLKDHNSILRKNSWLANATSKGNYHDVFLSFAIAGNPDQQSKDYIEKHIAELDQTLRSCGYNEIFNASKYFDEEHNRMNPPEVATEDFTAIENSKNFILFYPNAVPTSALMELGYALRDKKNILIISKNLETLPFLARGIAEIHENVRTLYYDDFQLLLRIIKRNHKTYLRK